MKRYVVVLGILLFLVGCQKSENPVNSGAGKQSAGRFGVTLISGLHKTEYTALSISELAPNFRTPRKDSIFCQEVSQWKNQDVVENSMHSLNKMHCA
ncbi:MAG: hypothetical protein PHP42_12510, partial [Bacteroidota bacterium]|nr:hypothetical protein [Bacteroidota bacterium]